MSLLLGCACNPAVGRTPEVEPANATPPHSPDADATADRLRDTILALNADDCAGEAEVLLRRPPSSPRLRAWAIFCVAEAGQLVEAEALATAMQRELPDEPWASFAVVAVGLADNLLPDLRMLPATAALQTALADHPDAWMLRARALLSNHLDDEVLELSRLHPDSQLLRAARARALLHRSRKDERRRLEAVAAARAVEGPAAIEAAYAAATWLTNNADALAANDLARARSPRSVALHRQRWRLLDASPGRSVEERRAAVSAAIDELLALRADTPSALLAASDMYRTIGQSDRAEVLAARLLAEFPDSPATEWSQVLLLLAIHDDEAPRSPTDAAEHRAELAAFLARPRWHHPGSRGLVAIMHFFALREDPNTPPDALLAAVEAALASPHPAPRDSDTLAILTLAERTPYLERAEALARANIIEIEAYLALQQQFKAPDEDLIAAREHMLSTSYDALGAVLLAAGRLDGAEVALRAAEKIAYGYPLNLMHMAELSDRRGYREAAQMYRLACLDAPHPGERNPCERDLEQKYFAAHGDLRGFPDHLKRVTADLRAAVRRLPR